ncbi:MAG: KH domain-containing protein [bacterium]
MEKDQKFVEELVRSLVNHPDDVKTDRIVDERGVLITLHVNPEDMGYVIGRQGQTARSIRTLLKIVGAKENARVNLKIHEPEGSTHVRKPRPEDAGSTGPMNSGAGDDIDTSAVDNLVI